MKEPKSETTKQELYQIESLNSDRNRIKSKRAQENKRKYEAITVLSVCAGADRRAGEV
jgi:hypothetical protein